MGDNDTINGMSYIKHKMWGTRFYRTWANIKSRCSGHYSYYKKVKLGWKSFEEFKSDMYESYLDHVKNHGEKNTSIDRINFKLGYNKKNCRWSTQILQCNNRKSNVFYTYNGERKTMNQWAVIFGIDKSTFRDRLRKYKWDFKDAIKK